MHISYVRKKLLCLKKFSFKGESYDEGDFILVFLKELPQFKPFIDDYTILDITV